MGLIKQLPCFIAGQKIDADPSSGNEITSLFGDHKIPIATTNSSQLRQALRYAESAQQVLNRVPLSERVEVVRFILKEYTKYRKEVAWGLAHFRGYVAQDSEWMCDLLTKWSDQADDLASAVWSMGNSVHKDIKHREKLIGDMTYQSKGYASFITSATMDGPPAVSALCHSILAGTHLILRPSWRDVVSHFLVEVLHDQKLDHYYQMVRWPSTGPESMSLNQQLIRNTQQAIIFCSEKTYGELLDGFDPELRDPLARKIVKYGIGLPLVIVTENADLDIAAEKIVLGARRGNGKFCLSHGPVMVHRSVQDEFVKKLVSLASSLKRGDPMDLSTEIGQYESSERAGLENLAKTFGGERVFGDFRERDMDMIILNNVPTDSPCLHRELPGTLLALIPYSQLDDITEISQHSLKQNHREAWTAVNVFGSDEEFQRMSQFIPSYLFLHEGITCEPRFLLPHQGRHFAFDLTRSVTTTSALEERDFKKRA